MNSRGVRDRARQQGLAMVELAIALPLLLLLLLGIGELGRLLWQYNSLLQASRDASRFVAGQAWNRTLGQLELSASLQQQARSLAVYGVPVAQDGSAPLVTGLSPSQVAVSAVGSDHVQVSISYPFQPLFGGGIPGFGGEAVSLSFPLVATSVMRAL
ncbi:MULTISPECIES: TadE/TadG family type IV pilus assembly protein [Stutzerimonas stutzeri subgroup]|uniref:TadE/TadG family type IV pilus assembly protein n=1 Tax=Stutzerimonas stutzeri subgroup TaxID=578833 RepID=UPI000CE40C4A|nr:MULTISPECIES: TadE/TadG family type IV pilus assembly protein [Stutzerimonas stutzeri subgroup]UEG59981.1 pilus assembly protein [Stutzerimonas chloritidismutans]